AGGAAIPLVLILLLVALVGVALVVALLLVAAWRKRKSAPGPGAGLELVAEVEPEPEPELEVELPAGLRVLPLQVLLDDADTLQALAELLDPAGAGGTRALAGRYGLSAAWVEHAYWLRSARSPLRAALQAVAPRRPHATLGGLAWRLAAMGRRDALQVLAGLEVPHAEPGPTPPSSPGGPGCLGRESTLVDVMVPGEPSLPGAPVCSHGFAG
ncbi:IGF-like family receptor 1, partial [Alligator sinensis]|uniref:IGF-like family receptor 1 n=1 Tax=Alligator sinensis TaxID=38654 RepID=A0A3Q0FR48_ALLSI